MHFYVPVGINTKTFYTITLKTCSKHRATFRFDMPRGFQRFFGVKKKNTQCNICTPTFKLRDSNMTCVYRNKVKFSTLRRVFVVHTEALKFKLNTSETKQLKRGSSARNIAA